MDLSNLKTLVKRCQGSPIFFIKNFCKVKHQKAGIIPFDLFSYQRKSIMTFLKNRFVIYRKTRQCFAGSSQVWTPNGPCRIDEIKVGDLIYSLDRNGMLCTSNVRKVYANGIGECVEVRTKTGHRSVVTPDHEFLTRRGYVKASNLRNDDIIIEVFEPQRYGRNVSKSEAVLLGYLLTDGHCGKRQVHFTNTRWKYLLEFQKHFAEMFGQVPVLKKHSASGFGTENAFRVYSYSPDCKNWLRRLGILGLTKDKKFIPEEVFAWSNESIAILINRMFAADGWYAAGSGGANELGIGQISIRILHQLRQLLSRFGINSRIYEEANPIPKLRISGGPDFEKFVKHIGIFGKEPRNEITKGFIFNRIKGQVKSVKKKGKYEIYDLEVPPYHNYVVDGAIVHNCGISTLTGVFALWYAMFFAHKTILIVSKRDEDAKEFLKKNVKIPYDYLPDFMKKLWGDPPPVYNEHQIVFNNGSSIKSLTCHPDTLRSNASSLNIIDESGFIYCMDAMWAGGGPTVMSGGSVIVISTPNGVGNWYHSTLMDAIEKKNPFCPIEVDWWDMDWALEYTDEFTGKKIRIAPRDGIRKCETEEEIEKWGPWYSPWLESQYSLMQQRGEAHKFRQEVLSEFIGVGGTILPKAQLDAVNRTTNRNYRTIETVNYKHPTTNMSHELNFQNQLWVWHPPVRPVAPVVENNRIIIPEKPGHVYTIGVDVASGEDDDFNAIEVIDCTARQQAAELNLKCLPSELVMMVDYLARWYNNAFVIPERTGIGTTVCQDLQHQIGYSNLFRMRAASGKLSKKVGFPTNDAYKPELNRSILDNVGVEDDDGVEVYSERLYNQLLIYIFLGNRKTGHVRGAGNHSDLVIAFGLALFGMADAIQGVPQSLVPTRGEQVEQPIMVDLRAQLANMIAQGGMNALVPFITGPIIDPRMTPDQELAKFMSQLGGIPLGTKEAQQISLVKKKKNIIQYPHR